MKTRLIQIGTRLVLAALILAVVFQAFGIAPKGNPVHAQTSDVWVFVEQTVPDGTCFSPSTSISVTWVVKNGGGKTWLGYTFNASSVPLTNVNSTANLTAVFNAPSLPGNYRAEFQLLNEVGQKVKSANGSEIVWLDYRVGCDTANSHAASQNGVTTLPPLKDGEFRQIDAGHVQFGYGGVTYDATPSPDNVYAVPGQAGTIEFYTVQECVWAPTLSDWFRQECKSVQKYFRDLGLPPAWTVDANAERQFYSFLNGVFSFSAFGVVEAGTLRGVNGWQWIDVGKANSASSTTISTALKGMARTGLLIVPAYLIMAGRVFVPVRDFTPVAVPAPVAPMAGITPLDLNPALWPPVAMSAVLSPYITTPVIYQGVIYLPVSGNWQSEIGGGTLVVTTSQSGGNCKTTATFTIKWPGMKNPLEGRFFAEESGPCEDEMDILDLISRALEKLADKIISYAMDLNLAAQVPADLAVVKILMAAFQAISGLNNAVLQTILEALKIGG